MKATLFVTLLMLVLAVQTQLTASGAEWEGQLKDIYPATLEMFPAFGIAPRGSFPEAIRARHEKAVIAIRENSTAPERLLGMLKATDSKDNQSIREILSGFYALGSLGKPVIPQLSQMLDDTSKGVPALVALVMIGNDAFEPIIQSVTNQNLQVRLAAVVTLGMPAFKSEMSLPILLDCLKQPDLRCPAIGSLGSIGLESERVVPLLVAFLDDPQTVGCAVSALGNYGQAAASAIPRLQREMNDPQIGYQVVRALVKIGPESAFALMSGLTNADDHVRSGSAQALAELGTNSVIAVKLLIHLLLTDTNYAVRAYSACALESSHGPAKVVVPALIKAMNDPDVSVRREAINAIDRSYRDASESKAAIPALRRALHDKSTQSPAILALEGLGEKVDLKEINQ